ncbi:hypothetical protein [Cognatilysobacter bugurensis]|nr:hypothetical protein [Lysobacter bugurensis]
MNAKLKKGMGRLSSHRALIIGALIVAISIAGLWLATERSGTGQAVIASISSALLSIGSLSLVYELAMRQQIHDELVELVGVERSAARARLRQIGASEQFQWLEALQNAQNIRVVLSNPEPWISNVISPIVDAAVRRKINVHILVPSSSGAMTESVASLHGVPDADFRASIDRAAGRAEATWRNRNNIASGSSIRIAAFDSVCVSTLALLDKVAVIISYKPCGSRHGEVDNGIFSTFDFTQEAYPGSWYQRHFEDVAASSTLIYENVRS